MLINLSEVQPKKNILPPRLVIYGPPKIGKSRYASTIPHNLILDIEGGAGFHNAARIDKTDLSTYDQFMERLAEIYTQNHSFKTLTIDTVDWLEQLIFEQAAKEHGKSSIADVGYGAGYVTAQNIWKKVLSAFDDIRINKNMMVILLAHEAIARYDNPMTESYDRYTIKLRNNDKGSSSASIIKEWSDMIGFANMETFVRKSKEGLKEVKRANTSEKIYLYTQENPAYLAGNRFGLPEKIPFTNEQGNPDWSFLNEALANAMMDSK